MASYVLDRFNGTASTAIGSHTPDINSGGWTANSGTWALVGDGTVQATGTQPALPRWIATQNTGQANARCIVRVKFSASTFCGIVFRWSDSSNYMFCTLDFVQQKVRLFTAIAGVTTEIASFATTLVVDTYYWLEVYFLGSTLAASLDGTQVLTATNSHNSTQTRHGLRDGTGLATFDSFACFDASGVGDAIIVAGQSNAQGRADNNQVYSHAGIKCKMYRQTDALADIADPTDSDVVWGSPWPLVATLFAANRCQPCTFVTTATGDTSLSTGDMHWAQGNSAYTTSTGQITDFSRNSAIVGMVWHQGEKDSNLGTGVTRAGHTAAMSLMLDDYQTDTGLTGLKMIAAQIGQKSNLGNELAVDIDAVRLAIADAWDGDADIYPGPVMYDQNLSDGVHFTTDAQVATLAARWWLAIEDALYSGTNGRGPRLSTAIAIGSTVVITFDRDLDTGDTTYTSTAWTVDNGDGGAVAVTSVDRTGTREVTVTCDGAIDGTAPTLTFASGNTASGATVPKTPTIALPETINSISTVYLPAEPIIAYAITTEEIVVTSPASADRRLVGTAEAITWTSIGSSGTVDIVLSLDNGSTYPITIVSGTPDDGTYSWTPTAGQVSATAKIKIGDAADAGLFGVSDAFVIATTSAGTAENTDLWYRYKQIAVDNGLELIEQ